MIKQELVQFVLQRCERTLVAPRGEAQSILLSHVESWLLSKLGI